MTAKQLKNSVLQMAVQGKLVPQNPEDEPASVLLEKIDKEKQRLIAEKKIKKVPAYLPVNESERLFVLPKGWAWCRLGELCAKIGSGSTPRGGKNVYSTSGIPFLRSQNIRNEGINLDDVVYIDSNIHSKMSNTEVMPGDILLNITGASLGRCALVPDDFPKANVSQHVTIIRLFDKSIRYFIHTLLLSPDYQQIIWTRQVGMAREGLSKATLEQFEIPLPPLEEQKRIRIKVDNIIPLLFDYQKAEEKITQLNATFPASFKKSILQSAIQGQLVPQNPNDEPASVLLQKIRKEREELIKKGKIKKPKTESFIFRRDGSWWEQTGNGERCIDAEIPFEIPESWEWVRLGEIGSFIRGNGLKRSDLQITGEPCVRYGELYTTYNISFKEPHSFVEAKLAKKLQKIEQGDVLFTLTGENKEEIGKAVVWLGKGVLCVGGDLAVYKWHGQYPLYLAYLLNSPYAISQKAALGTGNIIVHISCEKLGSILVPIPPLDEQKRIAGNVSQFMEMDRNFKSALGQ